MDRETLRKIQLAQLEISKEIRRVCEENDIKYFLDSGTLIGAVRHKGFIPWDDDMDIGMLREDYEKFLVIAPKSLSAEYFLQTWDSDEGYHLPFAKVRKLGTRYVEAISEKTASHKELYVDILPYDALPNDKEERAKVQRGIYNNYNTLAMKCGVSPWVRHKGIIKKALVFIKYLPYAVLGCLKDRETIKRKYTQYMTCFNNNENVKYVYEQWGATCGKHPIPVQCFEQCVDLVFEGELFKCPADYDTVLRSVYGDYMKLPPEDQRENRHQIIELKL